MCEAACIPHPISILFAQTFVRPTTPRPQAWTPTLPRFDLESESSPPGLTVPCIP